MTAGEIAAICEREFSGLVTRVEVVDPRRDRIRLTLSDGTFIDIHQNNEGRYSYHWARGEAFVRFNNAPHFDPWETTPHHLHLGGDAVVPSDVRGVTEADVRRVLQFIQARLGDHH